MKEWMCWVLLLLVVMGIILLSYYLTSTLPTIWTIRITILINSVVSCYLSIEYKK